MSIPGDSPLFTLWFKAPGKWLELTDMGASRATTLETAIKQNHSVLKL